MLEINKIHNINALDGFKRMPDESINCIVTSPPYWALRDYGVEGQLGLEPDFKLYIKHLCDIFDEAKRCLRKDGTLWVNLGDTYGGTNSRASNGGRAGFGTEREGIFSRFESKSLCNIPSRFSIEMQDRGWILRNKIIWHKPNCMPSSVTDRFTVDFEEIFFFVKNKKYFFEQQFEPSIDKESYLGRKMRNIPSETYQKTTRGSKNTSSVPVGKTYPNRNKRTVWKISTKGYKGAHFAVFPEKLVETPIKAGCPKDICTKCGKPREKIVAKREYIVDEKEPSNKFKDAVVNSAGGRAFIMTTQRKYTPNQKEVALYIKTKIKDKESLDDEFGQHTWTHWIRTDESGASLPNPEQYILLKDMLELDDRFDKEMLTTVKIVSDDKGGKTEVIGYTKCNCNAPFKAGVVCDPFMGSGTTAEVALKQHKQFIGFEINPKYIELAYERINPLLTQTKLDVGDKK